VSSEGGGGDGGGGWESVGEPPPALGKPPTRDGGSTLAASERSGGMPWKWPHSASVNMRAKCWSSRCGTQSRACEEDVAPKDRLNGEGESQRDGEPVGIAGATGNWWGIASATGSLITSLCRPSSWSEA
jgi:hypothetical protein